MYWNYRVVKRNCDMTGEDYYGIHECYYDDDDVDDPKTGWTVDPVEVIGEGIEELRDTLHRMLKALDRPVIEDNEPNP